MSSTSSLNGLAALTQRQREVLALMPQGMSDAAIAAGSSSPRKPWCARVRRDQRRTSDDADPLVLP
jgi:hypothetical protein